MVWEKKGLIYVPDNSVDWSKSHSQVPVALQLKDKLRIYYGTRNDKNQSCISFVETQKDDLSKVVYKHPRPILSAGTIGAFDDCGVIPTSVVNHNGEVWMYYLGLNVRNTVQYHNSIGLAISTDGGVTFSRYAEGPIWDRSPQEPFFSGSAYVKKQPEGWRMWYLSCTEWVINENIREPKYLIKHTTSKDGIHWDKPGGIAINYLSDNEAIAKPSVIEYNENWYMWYSYRSIFGYKNGGDNGYKIGFATSRDGKNWERKDHLPIVTRSKQGWDSEMVAYPHVIQQNKQLIMLYNGNHFGKSGFGWAKSSSLHLEASLL